MIILLIMVIFSYYRCAVLYSLSTHFIDYLGSQQYHEDILGYLFMLTILAVFCPFLENDKYLTCLYRSDDKSLQHIRLVL